MNDNTPGITPADLKLHERVAALEAVQERHDEDITKLSNKIDNLASELRGGFTALSNEIRAANSSRSRIVTAAISGGAAIGGGIAVGLYQIIHSLYPHFFGG